jgi:hypothetical protein
LEDEWKNDKRIQKYHVVLTAHQGKKDTGGTWSRPDITVVALSSYKYIPGKHIDIITFEVKHSNCFDIKGVYEALSHRRNANMSYLLQHIDQDNNSPQSDYFRQILQEAKQHGIGIIIFEDPNDYETWDEILEPVRNETHPAKLHDFIASQLPDHVKDDLILWDK